LFILRSQGLQLAELLCLCLQLLFHRSQGRPLCLHSQRACSQCQAAQEATAALTWSSLLTACLAASTDDRRDCSACSSACARCRSSSDVSSRRWSSLSSETFALLSSARHAVGRVAAVDMDRPSACGGTPGDRSRVLKLLTHARREVVFQLSLLAQSCNTLRLHVQRTQDKPSLYRKQRARSMPRVQSPGLVYPALARPPTRRAALSVPAAAVPPISMSTALPALAMRLLTVPGSSGSHRSPYLKLAAHCLSCCFHRRQARLLGL